MLYNESTGKRPVQADVFSLDSLIAWLETMPADRVYCYDDSGKCLHAQYFAALGSPAEHLGNVTVIFSGNPETFYIPEAFREIAITSPWTFGAALARARKAAQAS